MTQYYYVASSLPLLLYDNKAPIRLSEFHQCVSTLLSPSDASKVLSATIFAAMPVDSLSPLGACYWYYEKGLRNELIKLRALSLGVDPKSHYCDYEENPFVVEVAQQAFKSQSPLIGEGILNSWRWHTIDTLESGHYFDVDYFTAYHLKLQILERKELFEQQSGKDNFNNLYHDILKTDPNWSGV